MFGPRFNSAKCETTCRLALGRIKLSKNKRNMQVKQYRKDIADLLRQGKKDYARIRVEAVIRENLMLQALEVLELYLELIAVRSQLISQTKEIPRDMIEAISSVIYSAQRVSGDLPELTQLRSLFGAKYGKEYVMEAASDSHCQRWVVNENLRRCLTIEAPLPEDKLQMLSEIAQEHGVEWDLEAAHKELIASQTPHINLAYGNQGMAAPLANPDPMSMPLPVPPMPVQPLPVPPMPVQPMPPQRHTSSNSMSSYPSTGLSHPMAPMASQHQAPAAAGPYTDAAAAAAAAMAAAKQAQEAAEYAARFAGHRGTGGGAGSGAGGPGSGGDLPAPPPANWLASSGIEPIGGVPPAAATSSDLPLVDILSSSPTSSATLPGVGFGAAGDGLFGAPPAAPQPPSNFAAKTQDEIQKAYDAAMGPPAKPQSSSPGYAAAQSPPSKASAAGPSSKQPAAAPPAEPSADSELDELQKRFEALKRL